MGSEGSALKLQSDAIRCQATLGKLLAHLFWALLLLLGRNLYALSVYSIENYNDPKIRITVVYLLFHKQCTLGFLQL